MDEDEGTTGVQSSGDERKPTSNTDCNLSPTRLVGIPLYKLEKDAMVSFGCDHEQSEECSLCLKLGGKQEDQIDAISKRTRAQYSLADMSLDQLETFLQESDEEDYFQNVDDEEEYRKFLLAVQDGEEHLDERKEQKSKKEDEDDEEEDMDFEVELEEAFESDDADENLRKRKRRPETREKRRLRAQFQSKVLSGPSAPPLRQILPHSGNLADAVSIMQKRKTTAEVVARAWPSNGTAPVNGFTAHQIGQLYCLIHEHVQLLVQVFTLCILDPSRQQMANDTRALLTELVDKRELLLSWKKTAFPEFCFRPPYTHPSLIEDKGDPGFRNSTSHDFSASTSSSCTGMSTDGGHGYFFTQDHVSSSNTPFSHKLCRTISGAPEEAVAQENATLSSSSGPVGVDSTSLLTNGFESTNVHTHFSNISSEQIQAQVFPYNNEDPTRLNILPPEGLPQTLVQTSMMSSPETLLSAENAKIRESSNGLQLEQLKFEWAPVISGPVRSLLDVAPLALVRNFLMDMSSVVQEYRQRHVESGLDGSKCVREPLFVISPMDEQDHSIGRNQGDDARPLLFGGEEVFYACVSRPQIKKTMAAALVESTKKQSLALVPKEAATTVQRFLPFFNNGFFPHKPPPVATARRLLFTDAEDELLAMGLMMYNTDWKAIQQRFLPSKSMHQIFVRQKNRSSARAPENSIKAVRRMKSSPLTASEKSSIQEGLGMFKYDWNKVWQYCVPHRDPAVLPRQWRIAVGTQKSYKTSESSKERRRLYEANRRQLIAAKKASEKSGTMKEVDMHPSSPGNSLDDTDCKSGNEHEDNAYIREAFLADWCPRSSPPITAAVPVSGAEKRRKSPSSKKRKGKGELGPQSSNSSPWLTSQTVKAICQSRMQTVQLAPGLPSVKLPSCVHVLSQSRAQTQLPSSLTTRLKPVSSPWIHTTVQRVPMSEMPPPAQQSLSSSLSNFTLQDGGRSTQWSTLPSSHCLYRQGGQTVLSLKKVPASRSAPKQLTRFTVEASSELLNKKSRPAGSIPAVENREKNSFLQPMNGEAVLKNDIPSESRSSNITQHCHTQFHPSFLESSSIPVPSIQRLDLSQAQRKKKGDAMSTKEILSDNQVQTDSVRRLSSGRPPAKSTPCNISNLSTAATCRNELQLCSVQDQIQPTSLVSELGVGLAQPTSEFYQWNPKVIPASQAMTAQPLRLTVGQSSEGNGEECANGADFTLTYPTGRSKVLVLDCDEETTTSPLRMANSPITRGSHEIRSILVFEGIIQDKPPSIQQSWSKSMGRSPSRKNFKYGDSCVGTGSQESLLDQHIIVMEQEELSDSEDEVEAGLQFEHEEMGDSDKEA